MLGQVVGHEHEVDILVADLTLLVGGVGGADSDVPVHVWPILRFAAVLAGCCCVVASVDLVRHLFVFLFY